MRTCKQCSREFQPSSGHLKCPRCRHQEQKTRCQCGNLKRRSSITCAQCVSQKRELNNNWKGNRYSYRKNGYIMTRRLEHPRARKSGCVFEHVLVMEDMLGRYLEDGETVHHINGVKDDNRPENLELWCRPHPTGIRVEDAVEWAKKILERYQQ